MHPLRQQIDKYYLNYNVIAIKTLTKISRSVILIKNKFLPVDIIDKQYKSALS